MAGKPKHILFFLFVTTTYLFSETCAFLPSCTSTSTSKINSRVILRNADAKGATAAPLDSPVAENNSKETPQQLSSSSSSETTDYATYVNLLQDAINDVNDSTKAAATLLSKLTEMRENGESSEELLNTLLLEGPDKRLPIWSRVWPAKYSRRARLATLRRTLNQISPPLSSKDQQESIENKLQRRRRALVALLRSLSEINDESTDDNDNSTKSTRTPAIVLLERKAKQSSKAGSDSLISRRPDGLETPDYEVLATGSDLFPNNKKLASTTSIEIRRYKPYSVCSVSMNKPRPQDSSKTDAKLGAPELKGASAFGALAGYLFGKNDQSTAMKMTTPVFTTTASGGGSLSTVNDDDDDNKSSDRKMEFVLPSDYWGDSNIVKAPKPLDGSGVTIENKDSEERAVIMFSGYASPKETKKRTKELLSLLKKSTAYKAISNTESLAQYNDPFTLPWRRLNEVSVRVESSSSSKLE